MKIQEKFDAVAYQGTFRDYQRHLLGRVDDRLGEGKLNIVTPPGSGKTVLGLEMARRLGNPCLILCPDTVTCKHWGECLSTSFLSAEQRACVSEYLSYDLQEPALVTCLTYEALYAAVAHKTVDEGEEGEEALSFVGVDIIRSVQECGITTVVLDEAHHLREPCWRALETFLGILGGEICLISLTAVPPYDMHPAEWDRYVALCGEINDEICIPDLVKGRVLCPHRDYVYFNAPTAEETAGIRGYRLRADEAVAEAVTLTFMAELNHRLTKIYSQNTPYLYDHDEAIVGLLELLGEYGHAVNSKLYKHLTGRKSVGPLTLTAAEEAFNFLLESRTMLRDGEKDQLTEVFTRYRVMDHRRVHLAMTDKIRYTLTSSLGKLDSIAAITDAESKSLGENLREVILTDPFHGDAAALWEHRTADDQPLYSRVDMISVFDTLRRRSAPLPVGCVTDSMAILPEATEKILVQEYGLSAEAVTVKPMDGTRYAVYTFGDHTVKMTAVARLFEEGHIRVLIGSSDVLGEGWDDTFVNTLIVAVFHGSFVSINRMRGRVIHAHKDSPDKTAHIWHPATLENAYRLKEDPGLRLASRITQNEPSLRAVDYHTVRRRFECFIGPNETTGELETGIGTLQMPKAPDRAHDLRAINDFMLDKACDRQKLMQAWDSAMTEDAHPIAEVLVPKAAKVPVLTPAHFLLLVIAAVGVFYGGTYILPDLALFTFLSATRDPEILAATVLLLALDMVLIVIGVMLFFHLGHLFLFHLFPKLSIRSLCKSLLATMKALGLVSQEAIPVVDTAEDRKHYCVYLENASHGEQNIYRKAVAEMLSPIQEPRYILVRAGWFHRLLWRWSFACPSVIAGNDVSVKVFGKYIRRSMGLMKFQYTHRDPGRMYRIFARNRSYLNKRNCVCEKKLCVRKRDRH